MRFKDKSVLITGASSGIGEATAYEFARQGARLILCSNQQEELDRVKEKCNELGATCDAIVFDLGNPEEVRKYAKDIAEKYNPIDIFFSNGGISQRALIVDTPEEIDRKLMEINFFSGVIITKAILPNMIANGGGHILATASIAGDFGFRLRSAYCSSKHAVYGFYETLRAEMKDQNIRATVISPGRVRTNISLNALDSKGNPHGKMDAGQQGGITADKCAKKILKAIKKNKPVAYIGGKELLIIYLKRFFPRIFFKIVSKINPT